MTIQKLTGNNNRMFKILDMPNAYFSEILELWTYANTGNVGAAYRGILFVGKQDKITNNNTKFYNIYGTVDAIADFYTDGDSIYVIPKGQSAGFSLFYTASTTFRPVEVPIDISTKTKLTTVINS